MSLRYRTLPYWHRLVLAAHPYQLHVSYQRETHPIRTVAAAAAASGSRRTAAVCVDATSHQGQPSTRPVRHLAPGTATHQASERVAHLLTEVTAAHAVQEEVDDVIGRRNDVGETPRDERIELEFGCQVLGRPQLSAVREYVVGDRVWQTKTDKCYAHCHQHGRQLTFWRRPAGSDTRTSSYVDGTYSLNRWRCTRSSSGSVQYLHIHGAQIYRPSTS